MTPQDDEDLIVLTPEELSDAVEQALEDAPGEREDAHFLAGYADGVHSLRENIETKADE